jgi:energy-coupling factor transporter ATP-binding protein EcfA2
VPPQSVLGVAGPSGSGKSTLLKAAGGWLRPGEGRVLIDGWPATGDPGSDRAWPAGSPSGRPEPACQSPPRSPGSSPPPGWRP